MFLLQLARLLDPFHNMDFGGMVGIFPPLTRRLGFEPLKMKINLLECYPPEMGHAVYNFVLDWLYPEYRTLGRKQKRDPLCANLKLLAGI